VSPLDKLIVAAAGLMVALTGYVVAATAVSAC